MIINENTSRWDAETLAEAEKIKSDPNRLARAKEAAKNLLQERSKEQDAMKKVAGGTISRNSKPEKTTPQSTNDQGFGQFKRII